LNQYGVHLPIDLDLVRPNKSYGNGIFWSSFAEWNTGLLDLLNPYKRPGTASMQANEQEKKNEKNSIPKKQKHAAKIYVQT
jgi:hypothetical protein